MCGWPYTLAHLTENFKIACTLTFLQAGDKGRELQDRVCDLVQAGDKDYVWYLSVAISNALMHPPPFFFILIILF